MPRTPQNNRRLTQTVVRYPCPSDWKYDTGTRGRVLELDSITDMRFVANTSRIAMTHQRPMVGMVKRHPLWSGVLQCPLMEDDSCPQALGDQDRGDSDCPAIFIVRPRRLFNLSCGKFGGVYMRGEYQPKNSTQLQRTKDCCVYERVPMTLGGLN